MEVEQSMSTASASESHSGSAPNSKRLKLSEKGKHAPGRIGSANLPGLSR